MVTQYCKTNSPKVDYSHANRQALFSLKNKKKNKMLLTTVLHGTL